MQSKNERVPIEEINPLILFVQEYLQHHEYDGRRPIPVPEEFGIRSVHPDGFWSTTDRESLIEIFDKKRWFLTKIKHGI